MKKSSDLLIGIDIGQHSIKVVKVEKDSAGVRILDFLIKERPQVESGVELEPALLKDMLAQLGDIEGAKIYLVISGKDIVLKHSVVPFMPKDELRDAVRWSLKEVVNFNLDESIVDFQILRTISGTDGIKRNEILAVAVHKALIDKYVKLLEAAGVEPALITVGHFALANIIARNEAVVAGKINALVDVGFKKTTILVFKGTSLQFVRQISSSANSFTNALSGVVVSYPKKIELDYKKAEEIKRECGIPSKDEVNSTCGDIPLTQISVLMRPVLERFLTDIRGSFQYFREEFQVENIDQIILVGSGARLKNLAEFVREGLGDIPTELISLPANVKDQTPQTKDLTGLLSALAVSIGVCLFKDDAINLIPHSVKIRKTIGTQQRVLQLVAVILLIIIPFSFISMRLNEKEHRRILVSYYDYYSNLVKLRSLRDTIVKRQKFYGEIIGSEPNLFLYLKELSRLVSKSVEFRHLEFQRQEEVFFIEGLTYTLEVSAESSLSAFLLDLENSAYFNSVNLISSKKQEAASLRTIVFSLKVKLTKIK